MKIYTLLITILLLSILPADIHAMTMDEFMTYIADNYGHQVAGRSIVKDTKSFSKGDANYIKIKKDGLIIFKDTSISPEAREITFYGVTKAGEVLQFIQKVQKVILLNPLSNAPDTSGYWYQVKTVEGYVGWIYAGKNQEEIRTVLAPLNVSKKTKTVAKKEANRGGTTETGNVFWRILVLIGIFFLIIRLAFKGAKEDKTTSRSLGESSCPSGEAA